MYVHEHHDFRLTSRIMCMRGNAYSYKLQVLNECDVTKNYRIIKHKNYSILTIIRTNIARFMQL